MTKKEIIEILKSFTLDHKINPKDVKVSKVLGGHLNESYKISHKKGDYKYIIQKLNTVFDLIAIDHNLGLLDEIQELVKTKLSREWQLVKYFNSNKSGKKIHFYKNDEAYRLMEHIKGDTFIFDDFSQIDQGLRMYAAESFGEALATFGWLLSNIQSKELKAPLPNFHNIKYHYDYLKSVLNEEEITLSLSQNHLNKVKIDKQFVSKYKNKITSLVNFIEKRKGLITILDDLDKSAAHGDPKLNNAIFVKNKQGNLVCVSLVDLDTIQVGTEIDDLGDALRSIGNIAGEEPASLAKINIDEEIIKSVVKGYLAKVKYYYGPKKSNKFASYVYKAYAKFLYELGIRFFADSLVGNKYFKLDNNDRDDLNLYRAEVQLETLKKVEKLFL